MAAGKIKTLSIISIVLGALGLLGALTGIVALLADPQKTINPAMGGQTGDLAQVTQEMTEALIAVAEAWKTYNVAVTIMSFIVSAALLAGGIMSLKLRKQGRDILATTFAVGILLKVLQAVGSISIGMATMQISREFMPKIMHATNAGGRPLPAGAADVAAGIGEAAAVFGFALGIGWILLQIGFYIGGAMVLRKPEVRATFSSS